MENLPGQLFLTDIFGSECFKSINSKTIKTAYEYLLECVLRGSQFENGKERIVNIINSDLSVSDQIKEIKSEYGMGGCSCRREGVPNILTGFQTFGGKGFLVYFQDENCERKELDFPWSEVRKAIVEQINAGKYLEKKMAA